MARFCSKCGSPLNDEDKVCGNCGNPVARVKVASSGKAFAPEKEKSGNKSIKLIGAGIILIVAMVIISNVAGNYTGYKGTIWKMVKALQDYDVTTLISLVSPVSDAVYGEWYGDNLYDVYQEMVSEALDVYEDRVGGIKKISYEITNVAELSDRRMEEMESELVDSYNMDVSGIKKVMTVNMTLTVKGTQSSASFKVNKLYLIKESGGWKLYYGD